MEKKHHFRGFRKFSIKTRLVIALLMISIIPLVGISGYSFHIFSAALQEKLSASISQTLSMINLNMVSEIEKYQYLCGSICISAVSYTHLETTAKSIFPLLTASMASGVEWL